MKPGPWAGPHSGRTSYWTALRRRVQHIEETNLECRLAASMSEEAVAATHVRMALEAVQTLADEVTPDEAIMHYVRTFNLGSIDAQLIFRSALAQWAELHPLPGEARALPGSTPRRRPWLGRCASSGPATNSGCE